MKDCSHFLGSHHNGASVPTFLSSPGPVLLRRHVRRSKYEPLVDEVDLLHANPNYAHVRHGDGCESTVSTRDLAPCGKSINTDHITTSGQHNDNSVGTPDVNSGETFVKMIPQPE